MKSITKTTLHGRRHRRSYHYYVLHLLYKKESPERKIGILLLLLVNYIYSTYKNMAHLTMIFLLQSRPFLNDRRSFMHLADPLLQGRFPRRAFYQLAVVTSLCLHEQPHLRPAMSDVSTALDHIASQPYISEADRKNSTSHCSVPPRQEGSDDFNKDEEDHKEG